MKKNLLILLLFSLSLLVLSACAQGQAEAQPPEIRYGETVCEQCNMIISDERFASGYAYEVSPGRYESVAFDDIGDMLESAAAHPDHNVTNWYVHDYNTKEWLDATQAHYMFSEDLTTPMGHGTAAFADMAAAETLAGEMAGVVLDWSGLRELFERGEMMVHGGQMAHGEGSMHDMDADTEHSDEVSINILSPADGAVVGHMLDVQIATTGFDLMTPGNHWHVLIDGELAQMIAVNDTVTLHDVPPGEHVISVGMSNAQHEDLPQTAEISVTVDDSAAGMNTGMMHEHGQMDAQHVMMEETILGEADVEGYQLQVVSHAPLYTGYNVVMVHLKDATGAAVSNAEIIYKPMMNMTDGMNHAAGVNQPTDEMPGMYHGAIAFPMPSGPDLGSWTLAVSFTDPATGVSGETSFDIDVAPSALSGSFVAPDESKIFLMVVQPIAPVVGAQPFEIFAMQKAGAMDWPPVDDLDLEITPWMPGMDHGSLGNENPVLTGNGHYIGQVNFSMAGPWEVRVVASRAGEALGEVVFEYNVRN